MSQTIDINEYSYSLTSDRIALHPLAERDQSKLLVYRNEVITHAHFQQLADHLPEDSFLFFNDTKVIPARIIFKKETGAEIEIFLLNPISPSPIVSIAMEARGVAQWHVIIGNAKRWSDNQTLTIAIGNLQLEALLLDREKSIVEFNWAPTTLTFAEVIVMTGSTPLPPYLKRAVEESDKERYQTIYSHHAGAVAAPTAGLHFTDRVFKSLKDHTIHTDFLTLHVSAGTFQPVKVANAIEHTMHSEQMVITRSNLDNLLSGRRNIIAVGTTSLRTLESLYWYGVKLAVNPEMEFTIDQYDPTSYHAMKLSTQDSFRNVLAKMNRDGFSNLRGETSIYIVPGYEFNVCDLLITNFHQPGSTLMLLVAAFVGEQWKMIYQEALANNYRFLSYGDSSVLYRK